MENNSNTVKVLENVLDATETALRLAEDSVNASRIALAQTKSLFESIEDFDTLRVLVKICDNCHSEECRGRFYKCLCLRITRISYCPKIRFLTFKIFR